MEGIKTYAASLQKLTEQCDFGDTLTDALRDRLVCGMQNGTVQKRLLGKADLTFAKALEVSEVEEMATRDEAQLHEEVKKMIASDLVLTHFTPTMPLVLVCDASAYGLGAVLSHTSDSALGLNLTPGQGTPILTAARLQRSTHCHGNADALSRLPLMEDTAVKRQDRDDCSEFRLPQLEQIPVTTAVLRNATAKDPVLSRVLEYIGWPADTTEELKSFRDKRGELTAEQGCILWGTRVVIPASLQGKVLDEIYHMAVSRGL
eukprot:Em0003g1128a